MKNNWTSNKIREKWIEYFKEKNHYVLKPHSLIPTNDDSLLFVNSGIATIKKFFTGENLPPSNRLVNVQNVIRTNDIEIIGNDKRHHTFFEMLGNFSIGDYFKDEAIEYAWELLTSKKWFNINPNLLYITIFEGDEKIPFDNEVFDKWVELGVPKNHIFKMTRVTNFWDAGHGPCGPSTEIFYDKGERFDDRNVNQLIQNDLDNDRFIEIWNIVFSEYFNNKGSYTKLTKKNIDTGLGLERLVSCLQNTDSSFETDLFDDQINLLESIFPKISNNLEIEIQRKKNILKVVDFTRTVYFAMIDGVVPNNIGRGYIVRKLLRKIFLIGEFYYKEQNCFFNSDFSFVKEILNIFEILSQKMGSFYVDLKNEKKKNEVKVLLQKEAETFSKILIRSKKILEKTFSTTLNNLLNAKDVFFLYETYGIPYEIIDEYAKKHNKTIDVKEFENLLDFHRQKTIKHENAFSSSLVALFENENLPKTIYVGNQTKKTLPQKLISYIVDENYLYLVFKETPFLVGKEQNGIIGNYQLLEVLRNSNGVIIHKVKLILTNFLEKENFILELLE